MHPTWKKDGDYFTCDPEALLSLRDALGIDEAHMKRRMGYGFFHWARALNGERLTLYEKNHVQWGLTPDGIVYKVHDSKLAGNLQEERTGQRNSRERPKK